MKPIMIGLTYYFRVAAITLVFITGCSEDQVNRNRGLETEEDDPITVEELQTRIDSLEMLVDSVISAGKVRTVTQIDTPQARPEPSRIPDPATPTDQDPVLDRTNSTNRDSVPVAQARPKDLVYETYRNQEHGYSMQYPSNLFSSVEELGMNAGRKFMTKDGKATLIVFGTKSSSPDALKRLYNEELKDPNTRVTYKTVHKDWFVISGYSGGQVYYERAIHRKGVLKTFLILYDESEKAYFDPVTERISFSFRG